MALQRTGFAFAAIRGHVRPLLRVWFLRSAGVLAFAALVCASADSWAKVDTKFESWLGRTTARILESGDRVEVFVVGPTPVGARGHADDNTGYQLPPGTPVTIQRYPVRRVAASQGRAFAQQIARLVLDERSYEPRMYPFGRSVMKACAFSLVSRSACGREHGRSTCSSACSVTRSPSLTLAGKGR